MPKDNTTDSYTEGEVLTPSYFSADFYQKRKKGKYRLVHAPKVAGPIADTHCHIEMLARPKWAFIRCALHNVGFVCCVVDSVDDGPAGIELVEAAYEKAQRLLPEVVAQIHTEDKNAVEPVTITKDEDPQMCLDFASIADNPKIPELRFIVGCHPHYAKDFDDTQEANLRQMLKHPRVCAVGEIGLDFHYDLSPRDAQVEVFKRQLRIADELGFPVALHLREAHDVALECFDEVGFSKHGTLLHCFNLGPEELRPWVDAGCYVALGGPLTFKKSNETREAVSMIPADRLLTETDAPFMTPEPVRGDTCFPDHVIFTAEVLADATHNSERKQEFYAQLMANAKALLDR